MSLLRHNHITGRNRFGSIRFGSGLLGNLSVRFGSENNISRFDGFSLRFSDASWLGPVRFGSVPRPVPAGSGMKRFGSVRFGSVRFGRFGSVSYAFLIKPTFDRMTIARGSDRPAARHRQHATCWHKARASTSFVIIIIFIIIIIIIIIININIIIIIIIRLIIIIIIIIIIMARR